MDQIQNGHGNPQNEHGTFSWVCPKCHTINNMEYCCCCGYKRKLKKRNPWKIVSIILIVLLALICIGLFSGGDSDTNERGEAAEAVKSVCTDGHDFADANCEKPRTCKVCGETEGEALGHDYLPATCSQAARCSRCLASEGEPLGHNWVPATYDSPKSCANCGETVGNVKGFYESLPGDWTSTQVSVSGTNTYPWVFDNKVENCVGFTLHYQVSDIDYGKVFGKFTVHCKTTNGKWEKIGSVQISDQSEVVKTFEFDDPITFTQIAVVPPYRSSFSFSSIMWFENWYLRN